GVWVASTLLVGVLAIGWVVRPKKQDATVRPAPTAAPAPAVAAAPPADESAKPPRVAEPRPALDVTDAPSTPLAAPKRKRTRASHVRRSVQRGLAHPAVPSVEPSVAKANRPPPSDWTLDSAALPPPGDPAPLPGAGSPRSPRDPKPR